MHKLDALTSKRRVQVRLEPKVIAERSFKTMKRSLRQAGSGAFKTDGLSWYESTGRSTKSSLGATLVIRDAYILETGVSP